MQPFQQNERVKRQELHIIIIHICTTVFQATNEKKKNY